MHETPVLVSSRGEKVPFYAKRSSLMFGNKKRACGQSVNSGERENLFSIFCWLYFLGVQVRAQHGEFSQGARALMLKNLGDCEEF